MPHRIFINSLFALKAKSFLITIGISIAIIGAFNLFLGNSIHENHSHKEYAKVYECVNSKSSVEYHYNYINRYFDKPAKEKAGRYKYINRDDIAIQDTYTALAKSADSALADVGRYGKGLVQFHLGNDRSQFRNF
jgi:hypothetical protein